MNSQQEGPDGAPKPLSTHSLPLAVLIAEPVAVDGHLQVVDGARVHHEATGGGVEEEAVQVVAQVVVRRDVGPAARDAVIHTDKRLQVKHRYMIEYLLNT